MISYLFVFIIANTEARIKALEDENKELKSQKEYVLYY